MSVGEPDYEIVIPSVFSPLHTFHLCGSELVLFTRATSRSADQGGDVVHQAAKPHNLSFHNLTFSYYHAYWHALIEQAQRHILSFYHLTFFHCHAALSGCANNDHGTQNNFQFVDQKALQYIKYTFEARSAQYISVM